MTLFTVGPCEMHPSTLAIGAQQVPYFRNQEFSDIVLESERMFKRAVGASQQDKFIILTASGTGAMEAVVMNCLAPDDRVLVVDGGSFGHRFVQLCERHHVPCQAISLAFGDVLDAEALAPYENAGYTALLVNIHETSIGQLYDLDMLADFCKRNDLFFVVDAISSFAADPLDMAAAGIDALIVSSQKALSIAPGLSFVVLSQAAYESRVAGTEAPCAYFDFEDHVRNGLRGQTPFTPAVGIVYQLHDILCKMEADGGVGAWIERTAKLAADFRNRIQGLPVHLPDFPLSNAMTPVMYDVADAIAVNARLADEFGFVVNPCGGDLAHSMSRVAHIGNLTIQDNERLASALATVLADADSR